MCIYDSCGGGGGGGGVWCVVVVIVMFVVYMNLFMTDMLCYPYLML